MGTIMCQMSSENFWRKMIIQYHANGHAPVTILSQVVLHPAVVAEDDLMQRQVLQR
jgi:hypothetical protein